MRGNRHRLSIPWHVSLRLLHCSIALTIDLAEIYVNGSFCHIAPRHRDSPCHNIAKYYI